jgi:FkbH-like protein
MLDWLPPPEDFAARLRVAAAATDAADRARQLVALARSRLDFLQTLQLNRAMDQAAAQVANTMPRHRLALLGSATLDHLVPGIRVAALRRELWLDVHCGAYGQYRQEILDPTSPLRAFKPQTVVLSIAAAHAVPEMQAFISAEEVDNRLAAVVDELQGLWRQARESYDAAVIQQTFLNLEEPLFGNFDRLLPASPWQLTQRLNDLVANAACRDRVGLLDIARASSRDGIDQWFDSARMLQAKQEIAPQVAPLYGDLVARIVCAQRGMSKKCLVLDLDNTLWGGVLGDDGLQGIVLGQGSAAGEAYLGVQRYAKQLQSRGVILAVCSKNDPAIAEEAFRVHPEMHLKRSDIAAFVANWEDKARNLISIAEELNIGIDGLVFLDDNPAERARIREALPAVAVPELPADVSGYVRRLAEAGYFEATMFTSDDTQRALQYAQNVERDTLRGASQNLDEFLEGLQMTLEYGPFAAADMTRVVQLINKTNQFNPTTKRYSQEQVEARRAAPGSLTLQFRLRDRFGDNGLVSVMLLVPQSDGVLEIDTWVMSCRVFGRQLEHEAMNIAVESAQRAGVRELIASYAPTAKNGVVRDLYPKLGFRPATMATGTEGASRWSLTLSDYQPSATHIARGAKNQ